MRKPASEAGGRRWPPGTGRDGGRHARLGPAESAARPVTGVPTAVSRHAAGLWGCRFGGAAKRQAGGSQGRLHWKAEIKRRGERKVMFFGNKVSCSALRESMFSVICTTGAFKSASAGSRDFTTLCFSEPKFQIITPTSVTNEGSKTLEISESHLEPQRAKSLEASPGGRF